MSNTQQNISLPQKRDLILMIHNFHISYLHFCPLVSINIIAELVYDSIPQLLDEYQTIFSVDFLKSND